MKKIVLFLIVLFVVGIFNDYFLMATDSKVYKQNVYKKLPWLQRRVPKGLKKLRPKIMLAPKKWDRASLMVWRKKIREVWEKIKKGIETSLGGNNSNNTSSGGNNNITGWGNGSSSGGQNSSGISSGGNNSGGTGTSSGGAIPSLPELKKKILAYLKENKFPTKLYAYLEKIELEVAAKIVNFNLQIGGVSGSAVGISSGVKSQYENGAFTMLGGIYFKRDESSLEEFSPGILPIKVNYLLKLNGQRKLFKVYIPAGLTGFSLTCQSSLSLAMNYIFIPDDYSQNYGFMYNISNEVIGLLTQGQKIDLPLKTYEASGNTIALDSQFTGGKGGWLIGDIGVVASSYQDTTLKFNIVVQIGDVATFKDSLQKLSLDKNGNPICPVRHLFVLDLIKVSKKDDTTIELPLSSYGLGNNLYLKPKLLYCDVKNEEPSVKVNEGFSLEK